MSMFYELMMRKKTEIMYATIKGSLTENDGVFSGFSVGSCLLTQQEMGNSPFELVAKINLTTMSFLSPIFVGSENPALTLHIESSKLKMQIGNGTSWVSSVYTGVTTLSANTDYYVKLVFDGTKFVVYLSSDGTNWNKEIEWVNTISVLPTYYLKIGNDRTSSTYYLCGSIDLNNSYIKIGATKYNLQAVVGYTVVGSPTISDGVVSGFSLSNYLTIQAIDFSQPFEIKTSFILNSSATSSNADNYIFNTYSGRYFALSVTSTRYVNIRYGNGTAWTIKTSQYRCSIDTKYYIKLVYNGESLNIYISTDDITYTLVDSIETSQSYPQSKLCIGVLGINGSTIGGKFYGSIDIANSLIKVNNKLWFNGQQA